MQKELIRNAHNIDHFGVKKVVELLDRKYSISNVREKVERFIKKLYTLYFDQPETR
jgi:hypothetical protein